MSQSYAALSELAALAGRPGAARDRLTYLFDEGNFTELDAYAANGAELSGVITAFGYADGNPVYALSVDFQTSTGLLLCSVISDP